MANEQTTTKATKMPDTSVKLPEAVVRAAARAAELSEQQRTNKNSGSMAIVDINSSTPPIAEHASQTPKPQATTNPEPVQTPKPQATTNPEPVQTPREQPTSVVTSKSYSESDFKAMQGRFERAQQENKALADRVNEMQRLLATITPSNTNQVGRGDTSFSPVAPRKYITSKDEQEWSSELVDMARRAAREVTEDALAPVHGEMMQVRQSLGNVHNNITHNAQQQIYQDLQREVPDWETQNSDEGFKHWLNQIDPLSGQQRLILLNNAYNTGHASGVVAAFKGYKAEQAALGPAQTQGSRPGNGTESSGSGNATYSQGNPVTTPAVDLASLAAPGRARPGQIQASPDKPLITGAEITQFYADVTRGKYAGRDDEYRLIESQIQEALRDGRVRR